MAPDGKDYGTADDRTLVPGTLTVFRHFLMNGERGLLFPMNYNPRREAWSDYSPRASDAPYERGHFNLSADFSDLGIAAPVWEAVCSRTNPFNNRPYSGDHYDHPVPQPACSCGFYAHYDPYTDFYPWLSWGRGRGTDPWDDLIIVRAACEVSGTVVMGRLGVRAQKMKLVGLAVDWDKWRGEYTPGGYSRYEVDGYDVPRLVRGEVHEAKARAREVAELYGCTYHDDAAAMYAAHPKADVSALGVDTRPLKPKDRAWGSIHPKTGAPMQVMNTPRKHGRGAIAQQLAAYIQTTMGVPTHMAGVSGGYVDEDVTTTQSQLERVLEAKRNKPAPPGSGIDRRRGRLR